MTQPLQDILILRSMLCVREQTNAINLMGFSHILSAMKNEFYMEMFLEQCQVDLCLHFYWVSAVLD